MLSDRRVGRDVFFLGIMLKRSEGDLLAITLYKKDSFEVIPGIVHNKLFIWKWHE